MKFRYMAQRMINFGSGFDFASGGNHVVGKAWHSKFLARHPEIKSTRSHIINYSRINGASVVNINIFSIGLTQWRLAR
ncbi:hypothetical protein F5Y09DRAFT_314857 [Xylaria sp. FL1042]|nr:hypothetical protein F5Y09DRAFT_314857 [Xylaria sp. FL1042]